MASHAAPLGTPDSFMELVDTQGELSSSEQISQPSCLKRIRSLCAHAGWGSVILGGCIGVMGLAAFVIGGAAAVGGAAALASACKVVALGGVLLGGGIQVGVGVPLLLSEQLVAVVDYAIERISGNNPKLNDHFLYGTKAVENSLNDYFGFAQVPLGDVLALYMDEPIFSKNDPQALKSFVLGGKGVPSAGHVRGHTEGQVEAAAARTLLERQHPWLPELAAQVREDILAGNVEPDLKSTTDGPKAHRYVESLHGLASNFAGDAFNSSTGTVQVAKGSPREVDEALGIETAASSRRLGTQDLAFGQNSI